MESKNKDLGSLQGLGRGFWSKGMNDVTQGMETDLSRFVCGTEDFRNPESSQNLKIN